MTDQLKETLQRNNIDVDVVEEWTEGGEVISVFENDDNLCLLVEFKDDTDVKQATEYSFQRYFTIGEKTVCSVDKTFIEAEAVTLAAKLLNKKYE
jgi:hypothetical protein